MRWIGILALAWATAPCPAAAQGRAWTVEVEEPTGLERRDAEVAALAVTFAPGEATGRLVVVDADGREVPVQVEVAGRHPDGSVAAAEVLFPVTLIPGERPHFRLLALPGEERAREPSRGGGEYASAIVARTLGTTRLEIGNARFTLVLNLGRNETVPAIVEAYNRSAGEHRILNLVETTPDVFEPLPLGRKSAGWSTALGGAGALSEFTSVEIVEAGPLRGRVVLSGAARNGAAEEWELVWTAASPVVRWRARTGNSGRRFGFVFSSLSATPYEPFTHWTHGSEKEWPSGWTTDDPPHRPVSVREPGSLDAVGTNLVDLPGGHVVYYRPGEDYGALGLLEVDPHLEWTGVGSRQVVAAAEADEIGVALAFPRYRGTETILEARSVARRFFHPLLARIVESTPLAEVPEFVRAPRTPAWTVRAEPLTRGAAAPPSDTAEVSLDGPWRLLGVDKGEGHRRRLWEPGLDATGWRGVTVPGTVHTQVLEDGAWFTPEAEWVSRKEWWYRRSFRVPAELLGRRLRLAFGATDYYADVWLDGEWLGRHEGYIDPWGLEVGDRVRADADHTLVVRVWTPVHYYWKHRPYTVKGSYGAVDQKPDDITAVGLTRSVCLVASGPVLLDQLRARPTLHPDGSADVEVEARLDRVPDEEARVELVLAPRSFEGRERLVAEAVVGPDDAPDGRTVAVRFHLDEPRLWWTWDHGTPNLYTLTARVSLGGRVSDERSQPLGIRTIEKAGWVFYLNGRRFFVRGTNTYYLELFLSEMTRAKYEHDLALMRDMNVNMIRLHCHFANSELYDVADERGLLIWQDFLEAWYPHDRAFARRAAALYDPLIRMVRAHPSVALWATSDEEDLENYRVLTKHLAPRPALLDPERRPVHRSTGRYGDAHVYEGWYGGTIWEYTKTEERFISELGATALPNLESLLKFLPDHWPIEEHREDWIFRKLQVEEAREAWGDPAGLGLEEYIPRTQAYVALLHQLAIERMRRRKYETGGILHFHAIDFWPSVTMAALDYYRVPTASFHAVKRAFQLVLPSLEFDRDRWAEGEEVRCGLWVVNDLWRALPGSTVRWAWRDADKRRFAPGERGLDIAADSSEKLEDLRWTPPAPGPYELTASVTLADGTAYTNAYTFTVE